MASSNSGSTSPRAGEEVTPAAAPVSTPGAPRAAMALWLRALASLPWTVQYALATLLFILLRYVLRYRLGVARTNLQGCFPDCSRRQMARLVRAHYWQLAQVAVESLKAARLPAEEIIARVRLRNREAVLAEFQAGRSVLLLGAHQCNWEWSLHGVALQLPVLMEAAYKPLHSAAADRQLRLLRTRFGARLLMAKRLLRESMRNRRQVRAVALIADQVPASSEGRHWLSFLGRDTAFYPGPGEIARLTGYAAFFAAMSRVARGRYEIELQPISAAHEKLDPAVFTERYARLLEALIRAHPADWTWTHRRWKIARASDTAAPSSEVV